MNPLLPPAFHFESAAQWRACLVTGAAAAGEGDTGLAPAPRHGGVLRTLKSRGAHAPALAPGHEGLWRDDAGQLHRAMLDDGVDMPLPAPAALARTPRILATARAWWGIDEAEGVVAHERDILARATVAAFPHARVIDLAAARRGGVLALVERIDRHALVHIDARGERTHTIDLECVVAPTAIAALPASARVALLADEGRVVHALDLAQAETTPAPAPAPPPLVLRTASLRPGFRATHLAADGRDRWLLAGRDGECEGAAHWVLVLDHDFALMEAIALSAPATGLAATPAFLLVAHAQGVDVRPTARVAGASAAAVMQVVTPVLRAPDTAAGRPWLRADATVSLPEGTSAELSIVEVSDAAARARIEALRREPDAASARALRELIDGAAWSAPVVLRGNPSDTTAHRLSAPMHDFASPHAMVRLVLRAAPGVPLPTVRALDVAYASPSLADRMPMVFRRAMEQPGDFLRALIGVIEATTQETDARIASLGALIDPDTAPREWLDVIARWLGLPWDDALDLSRKRCIARHAGELAAHRGTRAGLERLLLCLFPQGSPADTTPRFRIVDVDADLAVARLGGEHCLGTALPALLLGLPRRATVLSRRTRLGVARLPCAGDDPCSSSAWRGVVRVDITAAAAERAQVQPWLAGVLAAMVPATARLRVQWRHPSQPRAVLDAAGYVLPGLPDARLGDAVMGVARLPGHRPPTLA